MSNLVRTIVLLLLAPGFWFLQTFGTTRPELMPARALPSIFSAGRAEQILARILGHEKPHPVSTEENAQVRARIVDELRALGLRPLVHHDFACHSPRQSVLLICASVNDVIAQVLPGQGTAIVLLAHYDSVPAGPGAADDESGVATVIETARALVASKGNRSHPVLAVLTDGEEADLLGAAAFLRDPALKARVGAVINVEARGNRGPSILFQTSPGDGPLIDLYARNTSHYATSSLYHEIYRYLPNDTDLTLFIAEGFPSFNFAYVGGVFDYHTANDTRVNLDPVSMQEQGDNMLGVARGLEQTSFAQLRGNDDVYFDVLGRWLPRLPVNWALPLALFVFLVLVAASLLSRGMPASISKWLTAFAITPALILIAAGSGFALHGIAELVSGTPDPSYAHSGVLRLALALALGGAAVLVSRLAAQRAATAATWIWLSVLGIIASAFVPGISPYFLFPAVLASAVLLAAGFAPEKRRGIVELVALLTIALVNLLVWSAIGTTGELIAGLKLHPMFTVPFALGLSTLVPLVARYPLSRHVWAASTAVLFAGAIVAAIVQGLQPSFSREAAQGLNITYVQQEDRAVWAASAGAPLPATMRRVASFSTEPERISPLLPLSYAAPAGTPIYRLPTATVISNQVTGEERRVTLALHGSTNTAQMFLEIPATAELKAIDVGGWHNTVPSGDFTLACMSGDCANAQVTLTLARKAAFQLQLCEHRLGLPGFASRLVASRPAWTVQSQNGDGVTLLRTIDIPAAEEIIHTEAVRQ